MFSVDSIVQRCGVYSLGEIVSLFYIIDINGALVDCTRVWSELRANSFSVEHTKLPS